ncbi:hybrid sensor histidine kinase/response regulator [Pseudomonas sp.]|uniref:hybrid sensor histidine kinase/response regulator n=1 Tax=Pseudomonas sp. TaxID=306 RepID=UPI002729CBA2|nr:PAS domain-containing protein [Pseudomonas sp.]
MAGSSPVPALPSFLSGGGEMGQRIREYDWAHSPLGPPEAWSPALSTLVGVILGAEQAMFVAWGPRKIMLYNDAYANILGSKHPAALGQEFFEAWGEVRNELTPLVDQVWEGTPVHMDDIALILHRSGYPEEAHFSFSYTPVRDIDGRINGLFCPCVETTVQVLTKRRQQEENDRHRRLFQQAPGFIAGLTGPEHVFEFTNAAFERLFGARKLVGRRVRDAYPELEGQGFFEALDEVYRTGRRRVFSEEPITLQSGPGTALVTFYLNFIYEPVLDESGQVTGIFVQGYDVSDTFRAQAALRDSEQRFTALAEALPTIVWTAHADGESEWLNEQAYRYSGVASGKLAGSGWQELIHEDDRAETLRAWRQALKSGAPLTCELRLRRRDGEYRWHLARAVPIVNDSGEITRWFGTNTDIEDQKQAAEALSKRNSRLQRRVAQRTLERDRVWRNSRDLLAVIDQAGIYLSANPAWADILGYAPEQIEGRHFSELVHPEDVSASHVALGQAFDADLTSFEIRYLHRDGSLRWVSWHTSAEGRYCYAYGRDITSAKQQAQALRDAEEQLRQAQKMEAVGQLTGGIAHDFNNLLSGIIGSLELMMARIEQGRAQTIGRYAQGAMQSAQRAAALTHRLLAFARRQPLSPTEVQADRLVRDMRDLIQRTLGPSFRLRLRNDSELWPTLCDPYQLESALLNICINARDAMPDGGLLTIETFNTSREDHWPTGQGQPRQGDYVAIRLTDTGVGMPAEVMERVVEPFFTTKPLGQGTGLGLSMVYGFARQSDGHLDIASAVGQGSSFTIYLPRYLGGATSAPEQLPQLECSRRACATVLVVEDESLVRELLMEALHEMGYVVMHAADGRAGRRQISAASRIDLLITDIGLPGVDGRTLASEALAIHPGIKVLYITGYAQEPSFASALEPGVRELITKPFLVATLKSRVIRLLESG